MDNNWEHMRSLGKDISMQMKDLRKIQNQIKKACAENSNADPPHDNYKEKKKRMCYMIRKSRRGHGDLASSSSCL